MSILQSLPFCLCESGPEQVDGVGNFHVQVLDPIHSQRSILDLYFLDSHAEMQSWIPSWIRKPAYDYIKQSQIDWFLNTSRSQRSAREKDSNDKLLHMSLVFQHIPLPEFEDPRLSIRSGHRREPTEGPKLNSNFYDALVEEGVSAIGCGHDHVNDFCAHIPTTSRAGPWLCYGGTCGFGGYSSYGKQRYQRRARVWELDTITGSLRTWMRLQFGLDRVNELVLVKSSAAINPLKEER
jgi:hypothetical protein